MSRRDELAPERVLVLTPTGRDAVMVVERLVDAGFECETCKDVEALLGALKNGAGVLLIAQEALSAVDTERLLAALAEQEPWSDVPVLLLAPPLSLPVAAAHAAIGALTQANVVLLQRPLHPQLLLSAVRSAVRARRRQYEMRDLHRELERSLQLSGLFVGILGHDLRTPLNAIKMSGEVLVRSDDALARRVAGRVVSSADRMARMIAQLLDFTRIRQGQGIEMQVEPADLGKTARQVVQELKDATPEARLEVSSSGDLGGRWDADRLAQVVSNLVGNALQHGTEGEPVTVELDGARPAVVRLAVCNAGVISEEAIPTLFEPFERASSSGGLGLGLFIARDVVRAHGGALTVRVVDGRTLFEAVLPREAQPVDTGMLTPAH